LLDGWRRSVLAVLTPCVSLWHDRGTHNQLLECPLADLVIRNFDDATAERLAAQAAAHGRSPEAEALKILQQALRPEPERPCLADVAHRLFGPEHGINLALPPRSPMRPPPEFK
jgi:plasmid stability protein